jgi:hypothetical protein
MTTATIDWGLLFELVWVAIVAGIAVALCFSLALVGSVRAGELRRAGRGAAATAYAALGIAGAAAVTGLVVFGLVVIVTK